MEGYGNSIVCLYCLKGMSRICRISFVVQLFERSKRSSCEGEITFVTKVSKG